MNFGQGRHQGRRRDELDAVVLVDRADLRRTWAARVRSPAQVKPVAIGRKQELKEVRRKLGIPETEKRMSERTFYDARSWLEELREKKLV
jgi:hypothetical protein